MERSNIAILSSYHGYWVIADLQCQILPRLFQLESVTRKDPLTMPNLLEVLAINIRIHIHSTGKSVLWFALLDEV
ncbi:hypothetical protein D3C75_1315210 [compost metagenome]